MKEYENSNNEVVNDPSAASSVGSEPPPKRQRIDVDALFGGKKML